MELFFRRRQKMVEVWHAACSLCTTPDQVDIAVRYIPRARVVHLVYDAVRARNLLFLQHPLLRSKYKRAGRAYAACDFGSLLFDGGYREREARFVPYLLALDIPFQRLCATHAAELLLRHDVRIALAHDPSFQMLIQTLEILHDDILSAIAECL